MDTESQSHADGVRDSHRSRVSSSNGDGPRITVVFSGALGDTVLLRPMMNRLRSQFAACRITLVTTDSIGQLFTSLGWTDAAVDINRYDHHQWFGANDADTSVPWARCDWLISGVSNGHDCWALAAQRHSKAKRISYFDPRPQVGATAHVVEQWCRQLGLAVGPDPVEPAAESRWNWRPAGSTVLVHPGSGGRAKCWPLDNFKLLARRLKAKNLHPRFILGPVECERMTNLAISDLNGEFDTIKVHDLPRLVKELSSALAFCGNDSGVAHLAAALGVPTLAIFICSNPRWWRPVGPMVRLLAKPQVLT